MPVAAGPTVLALGLEDGPPAPGCTCFLPGLLRDLWSSRFSLRISGCPSRRRQPHAPDRPCAERAHRAPRNGPGPALVSAWGSPAVVGRDVQEVGADKGGERPASPSRAALPRFSPVRSRSSATNSDGRLDGGSQATRQLTAGTYKLRFETGAYWEQQGYRSFYPYVEVVFSITEAERKVHIPLLLSPYSYSTYRGS
uniref:hydroxyisourate hydrolase n=1 Tax=Salvator merianae TaxID=96440 RepID=A0A8D0DJL2_SALMN